MKEYKVLRNLETNRWQEYKDLKLESLVEEPLAFLPGLEAYQPWTDEQWKKDLESHQVLPYKLIFVEADKKIIAIADMYYYPDTLLKHNIFLMSLYVQKKWRGKGIGRELIEERIKIAKEDPKIKNIICEIFSSQTASLELHKKVGFEVVGNVKDFILVDGQYYDKTILEKSI
ncbi:MAG: GNAT family N-acetyltransferase [Parcubacteria group bacterium]|nr:GNAT family N-acetyltransferase [Parcubacteria group bacterium]